MDAEKYAAALSNVLQNQHFMEMAEKLGQQIMSVRVFRSSCNQHDNPSPKTSLEKRRWVNRSQEAYNQHLTGAGLPCPQKLSYML